MDGLSKKYRCDRCQGVEEGCWLKFFNRPPSWGRHDFMILCKTCRQKLIEHGKYDHKTSITSDLDVSYFQNPKDMAEMLEKITVNDDIPNLIFYLKRLYVPGFEEAYQDYCDLTEKFNFRR